MQFWKTYIQIKTKIEEEEENYKKSHLTLVFS